MAQSSDSASDSYSDSDSDADTALEHVAPRPNRFTGKRSTWKGYTEAERHIAAALDQAQSGDLAAHLYNAHALRRRTRLPLAQIKTPQSKDWHSKHLWFKGGDDLQYTDGLGEVQTELVPPRHWTAWPLDPDRVPAPHERFGSGKTDEGDAGWSIKASGAPSAGAELREELLAVFQRLAKAKWRARNNRKKHQEAAAAKPRPRNKSRSKSVRSGHSQSAATDSEIPTSDVGNEDSEDPKTASDSAADEKPADWLDAKHTHTAEPRYAPIALLADDAKARRLLQPSVNSLLSQLDEVALAIRRSRLNHSGKVASGETSGSEFTSDAESVASDTAPRPGTRERNTSTRPASARATSRTASRRIRHASQVPKESITTSQHVHDSDSASDYGADVKLKNRSSSTLLRRKRARSEYASDDDDDDDDSTTSGRYGHQENLLDWSEVLGLASITGWNERAVARTAQRCAALFGEAMAFRAFDESLATQPAANPIHYTPSTMPAPPPRAQTAKRPIFEKGTLRCPHADCRGHQDDFELPYRVIEHVKRVHGYDPRTNNQDNEDRKMGGVHRDGFLQPIGLKPGWLGGGRAKGEGPQRRKRMKKEEQASDTDAVGRVGSSPS
ncbi:hypothetical protein BDV95DRAFT_558081 [Massariosphaeria phaeospora]|uniref:Rrn9 domain-containing protein n=1 Tax=Massariosphaeria phaeospora TaxID=100035 RepID=A0A7C8IDX6_9PLEO|nr:hypothetical protein BDV95DRAFT_558081 [Massariosphaeria phaeospora]